ncbi:MAG TPA: GTP-binding protein [Blastocatellia bacterium]|nr:GTP-binding protein [Blastocatellia bacterium]
MNRMRFLMVGGFLGAGKTTTLGRLARGYMTKGLRVGIVTNDQASDLVDTQNLRRQGFDVEEVPGACFCCRFDDLVSSISRLGTDQAPDVILAEPVGSCTDLVATVVQPLRQLYPDRFRIGPYSVILKPSHGRRILRGEEKAGFSPKAAYIFRKQLEEADAILLNRIDELSFDEADELMTLVREVNSDVPILRVSAKTGQGFAALEELLDQDGNFGRRILDLDYDLYAAGEAELGWLNSSVRFAGEREFELDGLLLEVVHDLRDRLGAEGFETAHLKVIGLWEGFFGVANLVSSDSRPDLSLPSHSRVREVDVIVNARVAGDPDRLEHFVREAVLRAGEVRGSQVEFNNTQSFRPARPVPTHRFS